VAFLFGWNGAGEILKETAGAITHRGVRTASAGRATCRDAPHSSTPGHGAALHRDLVRRR
jgi:hypothetical protein